MTDPSRILIAHLATRSPALWQRFQRNQRYQDDRFTIPYRRLLVSSFTDPRFPDTLRDDPSTPYNICRLLNLAIERARSLDVDWLLLFDADQVMIAPFIPPTGDWGTLMAYLSVESEARDFQFDMDPKRWQLSVFFLGRAALADPRCRFHEGYRGHGWWSDCDFCFNVMSRSGLAVCPEHPRISIHVFHPLVPGDADFARNEALYRERARAPLPS